MTPSQGGNIYPHLNNPYPTSISPQNPVTMPIQTSSDHFGMNQDLTGLGHGVHQDPAWLAIFQNQSFPRLWTQMPPSITIPVIVSHTGAPSPTYSSHVEDESTSSTNYVDNFPPTSTNYVGGTIFSPQIIAMSCLPLLFIIREMTLYPLLVTLRSPTTLDVSLNSFAGLAKEFTLLICVQLLLRYPKHGVHPRALQILRHVWFLFMTLLP
jgi:hypothetical protein